MRIDSLYLKNFRNVAEQRFAFNPHFTVLIGANGKGKSTWLQALRVACGAYLLAIPEAKKRHITPDEIRIKSAGSIGTFQRPVVVEATGTFEETNSPLVWRRRIPAGKTATTSSLEDVGAIRNLGKAKYDRMEGGDDALDLPVIAFFGTSRVHGAARNRKNRTQRLIFKEGYQSWFEMRASVYGYENWLATFDAMVKQKLESAETREAFFQAIRTACPYIQEIKFEPNGLYLSWKSEEFTSEYLPVHQHSDGIQAFVEMVAEIAYRCIILNGYKRADAVTGSHGVVMIDELDMHLHPDWQRHVVSDLKNAFPNIQFVATTHSPFIVQSLASDELINLDRQVDVSPQDMAIQEVATFFMGVDSAFSVQNTDEHRKSKKFMESLGSATQEELAAQLDTISDPAVRAFLEITKMANGK